VIEYEELTSRLATGLALTTGLGIAALLVSPVDASARKTVWRVQLDGDQRLETVLIKRRRCDEPYPCTQLVLRDGKRRVKLTRISQRPKHPFHWEVTKVRFRDLTGDGVAEVMWDLFTVGGTGSSPSLKGVHRWDGRDASRIFRFANGGKPPPGYAHVIGVSWRIVKGRNGGLAEIETTETLHKRSDATCCPSALRVSRHRWNGTRIAPVAGSRVIEPASAAGTASVGRVAALGSPRRSSATAVTECGHVPAAVGLIDVRARNATCGQARRVARRWLRKVFAGDCTRFVCVSHGYRCRAKPPAMVHYRVRCKAVGGKRIGWTVIAD
jgi:hypothetical protein